MFLLVWIRGSRFNKMRDGLKNSYVSFIKIKKLERRYNYEK